MAPTELFAEAVTRLHEAIDRLAQEDLELVPAISLSDDLRGLRSAIDRMEAEFSRRLERFDRNQGYVPSGHCSAAGWLNDECRMTRSTAWERVRQARRLAELPATSEAFAAGEVNLAHVGVITRSAEQVGCEALRDAEPIRLEAARRLDARQLRYVTAQLRHCLDPNGSLKDANRDYERRHLYLSEMLDGMFAIDGMLDPEGGSLLQSALDALMGPPQRGDGRTTSQRRADALMEMAQRQLDQGELSRRGCQRPHLTLIAQTATLKAEPGAPAAELESGQPVPGEMARRIVASPLCGGPFHASVTRVGVGAGSEILSVGRATRAVPAALRTALMLRDRHCQFPGCGRPARWADAHHIEHWIDGGRTCLSNLILVCRRCHRAIHEGGWRLVRDACGTLTVTRQALPP